MKKLNDDQKTIVTLTGTAVMTLGLVAYVAHSIGFVQGSNSGAKAEIAKQCLREIFKEP